MEKISFSFGKNWEEFVENHFNAERVLIAKEHLLRFLEMGNLEGKYFLDIGCGSGLSSLAAFEAGAQRIVSFDVDPRAVKTTAKLREIKGNPFHWTVLEGSILDSSWIASIEPADIVYAWGVLHHTGQMWKAIENASRLIKKDGLFYIALYTTTPQSAYWIRVKKKYNRASELRKRRMEGWYMFRYTLLPHLMRMRNPFSFMRRYKKNRGMSYFTDVRDWLGGYPYEDAKPEEVIRFCRKKLNLELVNLATATGEANTEYLFAR